MKIESTQGHQEYFPQQLKTLNYSERARHALKGTGMLLALAFCCLFIPVFHFVLVPLFLFLSLIMGVIRFREDKVADLDSATCPICKNKFKESQVHFRGENFRLYCFECRNHLTISAGPE